MYSAHLGLDCLTPEFPFGKKVTVPLTTMSDVIDEKTTKETATKGLAVAPVGFLITSQLVVKSMAQRFMAALGRSSRGRLRLRQPRDKKSKTPVLLDAETIPPVIQEFLCIKAEKTHPVHPLPCLSFQDATALGWCKADIII